MWPCSPCILDLQGLKWEFAVIDSDQVNAFVVPGGKVVVYTGLLKLLQEPAMETQLAAVLGHEIAHVVARHAVGYARHRETASIATVQNSARLHTFGYSSMPHLTDYAFHLLRSLNLACTHTGPQPL